MIKIKEIAPTEEYVYDISLDGTVVIANGDIVASNTDGFNFALPKKYRYTKEKPYIGKGLNRNVKEGKEYTELVADIAEFNDMFMRGKMGLGLDEIVPASINISRKNYMDLLKNQEVKLVGNTVKSRRLSGFIANFLDEVIPMLLAGNGKGFLESYYDYIEKIYNYQIPLRDIASKGKIKKTIAEYKEDCQTHTKAGNKKSRQVWYELAIEHGLNVNLDDTLYYVNTGKKDSDKDVKRVTKQYVVWEGNEVELAGKVKSSLLKQICEKKGLVAKGMKEKDKKDLFKPYIVREVDEVTINCKLVPNEIVEAEEDIFCTSEIEYNVEKYINQFNNRIKPLLVCFHPNIREKILIQEPTNRQYFTETECELVSGYPNKEIDQDTYEALMTPERKEIEFWVTIGEEPPFINECKINWETLVQDYKKTKEKEKTELFKKLDEEYVSRLMKLTQEDINKFEEEYTLPSKISELVELNPSNLTLYFKELPDMTPSTGGYLFDDIKVHVIAEDLSVDDNGSD